MTASLQCPTCSAPLDPPAHGARMMTCPYCGASALLTGRLGHLEATAAPDRRTEDLSEVVHLLRAGRKREAVKAYEERFGVGSKDARDAVERIEAGRSATAAPAPVRGPRALLVALGGLVALAGLAALLLVRQDEVPPPGPGWLPASEPPVSAQGASEAPAFAEPVLRFGSEGTGAGRFDDARSVAVDGAGHIYVAEYQGGRVQVFDSLGLFLTQWLTGSDMPLTGLAADRSGTVYVVQQGRVRRHEGATGAPLPELPRPDRALSFDDVTVALDGSLWATAFPAELVHFGRDGALLQRVDLREAVDDVTSVDRVAVAGTGDVYVTDRATAEVYRLDGSGRFADRFGGRGGHPGNLSSPLSLALDGRGRVLVGDFGGVRVFDAGGNFLGAFGDSGVVFGLAVNDRDEVFAAHRNAHEVVKYRLLR